jgi:hypothetical protein
MRWKGHQGCGGGMHLFRVLIVSHISAISRRFHGEHGQLLAAALSRAHNASHPEDS